MRCPQCNYIFSEEKDFCPRCGKNVTNILKTLGFFPKPNKEEKRFLTFEDLFNENLSSNNKTPEEIEFPH